MAPHLPINVNLPQSWLLDAKKCTYITFNKELDEFERHIIMGSISCLLDER